MPAEATTTLLFTDLVGSTALLSRLGEAAGTAALEDHLDLLRGVMQRHGGQEIKSLGDGLMVTFPGAVPAVTCAVEMQQAVAEGGSPLGLRVGLNAGEPDRAHADLYGMSVVEIGRASGGESVCCG